MKKSLIAVFIAMMMAMLFGQTALAGTWIQEPGRPANQDGVTNWWWKNDDGTYPKNQWAWIDGNNDGLCQSYYFNEDGYLLASTTTPDNYTVDANGAWTKDGTVQVFPNAWAPGPVLTAGHGAVSDDRLNPINSGYSYEKATHSSMSDEEAYNKLMQLKAKYPEGTRWDDYVSYVSGKRYGYGCAAFIFMVQDSLYGAPAKPMSTTVLKMDEIRIGDHLRVQNNTHSVIVIGKGDGYVMVAEGAYYGTVHWGRKITEAELRKEFAYRESCY